MEITTLLLHLLISIALIHGVSLLILLKRVAIRLLSSSSSSTLAHAKSRREIKLRIVRYSSFSEGRGEAEAVPFAAECAVCLSGIDDGEEIRELACRHLFHRACLDRWLDLWRATCPLCRCDLASRGCSKSNILVL